MNKEQFNLAKPTFMYLALKIFEPPAAQPLPEIVDDDGDDNEYGSIKHFAEEKLSLERDFASVSVSAITIVVSPKEKAVFDWLDILLVLPALYHYQAPTQPRVGAVYRHDDEGRTSDQILG